MSGVFFFSLFSISIVLLYISLLCRNNCYIIIKSRFQTISGKGKNNGFTRRHTHGINLFIMLIIQFMKTLAQGFRSYMKARWRPLVSMYRLTPSVNRVDALWYIWCKVRLIKRSFIRRLSIKQAT